MRHGDGGNRELRVEVCCQQGCEQASDAESNDGCHGAREDCDQPSATTNQSEASAISSEPDEKAAQRAP
jgi:hypothetical protein